MMAAPATHSVSIRYRVDPRLVPAAKAARRLGLPLDEFHEKLEKLMQLGLPAPCPVTGHFDLVAIDMWLDRRAGLATASTPADRASLMRERIARLGQDQA
ncbi:hypothetical protein [Mesorhizobium sp. WSM2239]|uniref:DNA-binding protein n=2 Tax=unclassified Mesorhizobium TaxID=325217 RepID=A0AAU8D1F3_9HYPH